RRGGRGDSGGVPRWIDIDSFPPDDRDRLTVLPPRIVCRVPLAPPLLGVRRPVLAPLLLVIPVPLLLGLPFLVILAAAASPLLPGRWRALRLLWFGLVWLAMESVGLFACLTLWVGRGVGGSG